MNNLLSYYGLVDERKSASDKELPISTYLHNNCPIIASKMHYTSVIFNLVHIHKAQAMCEVIESSLKMESNFKFLIVFSIFCLIFLFNIIEFRFRFELLNPESNHPDYIMLEQVNIIQ